MKATADRVLEALEEKGWRARIVPIEHLDELRDAIEGRHERGLFEETVYRELLTGFRFARPEALPDTRSILIIAVPVARSRVVFHRNGASLPATVPPTYVAYSSRTRRVLDEAAAVLAREGHALADAALPLKTLAVRSGLAEYGRSNIVFVRVMGSFLQLVGAFTDLPCAGDSWREPRKLERCERCVACLERCPGGAITRERFLLHVERCLTYHNERLADFPNWIDPSSHHCLVGCMRCQEVCPENRPVLDRVEDRGEFSESETEMILNRVPLDRLPEETVARLRGLELNEPYPGLCRNLSMIANRAGRAT